MSERYSPTTVQVYLGPRSYEIAIADSVLESVAEQLQIWLEERELDDIVAGRAFVVTDANVEPHAAVVRGALEAAGWTVAGMVLEPGEPSKRLDVAAACYEKLVAMQADRHTVVLAVGGGVVGDLGGFVAATYARGVPFVQVPTTLLANVDSSVGGKVGINLPSGKNLVGAFHQPLGVFIDIGTLGTLPDRDYRSGLAEVVKYGVILDAGFFEYLEKHAENLVAKDPNVLQAIVARSCRIKADIVERDEEERTGLRAVLNYGHTFAHAYEALTGYEVLRHGEAVAVGMIHASRLAERLELIDAEVTQRQVRLLEQLGLPTALPEGATFSPDDVLDRMRLDKKSKQGRIRFILPTRLGHVRLVDDVPEEHVRAVLSE